jgi:hypothetical protein
MTGQAGTLEKTNRLTRVEDAYAHLASFQRGDEVTVAGLAFSQPGIVTLPQQDDHTGDLTRAWLVVTGCGVETAVTVAELLSGEFTITRLADLLAGRGVRYFDEAAYATQNGRA